jgi:ABC-type sugar transport systems, permease components
MKSEKKEVTNTTSVKLNKPPKLTLKQWFNQQSVAGFVCVFPFTFGFFAFTLIPVVMSLYYSFTSYNMLSNPIFIGLENYVRIFTEDTRFLKSLGVTFFFALTSVPLRLVFALLVAMILVKSTKASAVYRAVYYLPSIIGGSVAVAILWKQLFATRGVINTLINGFFGLFGIDSKFNHAWLGQPSTAIWTLIILAVWQFGSSMLIFLSAIKQIPASYYEAADVDGASKRRQFFSITLPLLTPTIFFNLVMQTINGFLAFTQCYIITQGKPLDSTLFYTVYMYEKTFTDYSMGYGSALAWIMLFIIGAITLLLFKTKKFWVVGEGEQ